MDDKIIIRTTHSKDKDRILKILSKVMSPKFMPEMKSELEEVIKGNENVFGLSAVLQKYSAASYNADTVVGYITLWKTVETYKIETLAVDPNYQGRGIGKKLVTSIEEILIRNEKNKPVHMQKWPIVINVVTDAAHDNPVVNFYEKLGYNIMGIIPNEFSYGDKTVHLSKIIKKS